MLSAWLTPCAVLAQDTIPTSAEDEAALIDEAIEELALDQALPAYGAKANVRDVEEEPETLTQRQTQRFAERLGPAFSPAESLPGAVPVFSGVPYLIVRGAPPAGTRSYYDGVIVPSLYHVALGPQIVHAPLAGALHFHPSVAPARYGRKTGGVIAIEGPDLAMQGSLRVIDVSLLDTAGSLQHGDDRSQLAASYRFGNPGLMLHALGLDATLSYFDYMLRYAVELSPRDRVVAFGMGGGDRLGEFSMPEDDIDLQFHRALLRWTRSVPSHEINSELMVGYDTSTLGVELEGAAVRVAPNMNVTFRSERTRLRVGTDFMAVLSDYSRPPEATPLDLAHAGEGTSASDFTLDPQDFIDNAPLASVPTRNMLGLYAELHLVPLRKVELDLGLRSDLWLAGSTADASIDPRAQVTYRVNDGLALHLAAGLAHGPHASPVPLPGLEDVALDTGIERSVQTEVGAALQIGPYLLAQAALFYSRYDDVVYFELILDCEGNTDPQAAQALFGAAGIEPSVCREQGLPTADGNAYGFELHLQRDLSQRVSGFLSYTLAFADATAEDGTHFTPQSDVRHLANLVLQLDLGRGFSMGSRTHARTGKVAVNTIFDSPAGRFERVEYRMPAFFRADVYGAYAFRTSFARMKATLGFQNVTFSREATNRDCYFTRNLELRCELDYQPPIVSPNIGLRGEF